MFSSLFPPSAFVCAAVLAGSISDPQRKGVIGELQGPSKSFWIMRFHIKDFPRYSITISSHLENTNMFLVMGNHIIPSFRRKSFKAGLHVWLKMQRLKRGGERSSKASNTFTFQPKSTWLFFSLNKHCHLRKWVLKSTSRTIRNLPHLDKMLAEMQRGERQW